MGIKNVRAKVLDVNEGLSPHHPSPNRNRSGEDGVKYGGTGVPEMLRRAYALLSTTSLGMTSYW